jgi:hypothetical protein
MSSGPKPLLEAALQLIDAQCAGAYPGGTQRRRARWRILTRHVRPAAIASLKAGMVRRGVRLYARTFVWQLLSRDR